MSSFVSPAVRRTNLKSIKPVVTEGSQPLSRIKSSSAVTNDGKFFLFGGFDEDDNYIYTNLWSTYPQDQVYREGHSSLFIGKDPQTKNDTILIYGGVPEESNNSRFNHSQLVKYHVQSNEWESIQDQGPAIPEEPRSRHAACLSQDGTKMFISGGLFKDDLNDPYDDLRIFDITRGVWEGSRKFICRFDHYITYHDGKIWALGGLTKEMAHVTEISWFDLQTNITGSIKINQLPRFQGDHIFMNSTKNSSLLLDVVVPLFSMDNTLMEPCIGLYDLNSLRWHAVLTGAFDPLLGHKWKHTFIHESKLYLLGYPISGQADDTAFDYNLKTIIGLDLADLGIVERSMRKRKYNDDDEDSMSLDFKNLLNDTTLSDFQIFGIEGNQRPSLDSIFLEPGESRLENGFQSSTNQDTFIKSSPIKVHTTILFARWPHFKRILQSGMQETKTNTLFIPEPIKWIKSLIEYFYTNDLSTIDQDIISGLLILSNIYEVPKLRKLCLDRIYSKGFNVETVMKVWSRARYINEEILAHNASNYCSKNWDLIIRSPQFEELSKEEIINFCRDVKIGNNHSNSSSQLGVNRFQSLSPHDRSFNLNNYDRDYSTVDHGPSFGTYGTEPNFGFPEGEAPKDNEDDEDFDQQTYVTGMNYYRIHPTDEIYE
ncbi:Kelch-like protein 20 [Wickerhamomyces ciferrii]|uniref:Kelch-like protein 20 n=1 Tax=Wickerhamomyces ciferrii (strain ATCC 14091 / BCRC 22168 / CBS 111 / JCM 3599 / NBRC 0793 / NRRL Y-1031 F-60-10) TaxID=1206466 RepID=K0KUC5_WICCF|nr:Kelch-like protein 20 [Wickerhamomyces ciferrii]CCH44793.1 Kelch-like protein 20 [Wickerhamomyces ciferrii]